MGLLPGEVAMGVRTSRTLLPLPSMSMLRLESGGMMLAGVGWAWVVDTIAVVVQNSMNMANAPDADEAMEAVAEAMACK